MTAVLQVKDAQQVPGVKPQGHREMGVRLHKDNNKQIDPFAKQENNYCDCLYFILRTSLCLTLSFKITLMDESSFCCC